MDKRGAIDYWIFIVVLALLFIGIIMVFSSSTAYAYIHFNDSYYFMVSQLKYAFIGLIVMLLTMNYNYRKLGRLSPIILIISIILLILVKVPGIGVEKNGALRWINIAGFQFQPSEVTKIAIVLFPTKRRKPAAGAVKSGCSVA